MTFMELCRILKHYLAWVIAVPVLCAIAGFAYGMLTSSTSYTATASIDGSTYYNSILGYAKSALDTSDYGTAESGYSINTSVSDKTQSVMVEVSGKDPDACVETVNRVIADVQSIAEQKLAYDSYDAGGGKHIIIPRLQVTKAQEASPVTVSKKNKYAAAGFGGGLVLIIIVLILVSSARGTISTSESLERKLGVRRFGPSPEALATDIKLACKGAETLHVVSTSKSIPVDTMRACIDAAAKNADDLPARTYIEYLGDRPSGALEVEKSQNVILAVRPWKTTVPTLEETVRQLDIAQASIVGLFEV